MKQSRMSNRKIAGLTIAAVGVAVVIAMISMPSTETKTAESAPLPVTNTNTVYFPSQFINKATGLSDLIPSFEALRGVANRTALRARRNVVTTVCLRGSSRRLACESARRRHLRRVGPSGRLTVQAISEHLQSPCLALRRLVRQGSSRASP